MWPHYKSWQKLLPLTKSKRSLKNKTLQVHVKMVYWGIKYQMLTWLPFDSSTHMCLFFTLQTFTQRINTNGLLIFKLIFEGRGINCQTVGVCCFFNVGRKNPYRPTPTKRWISLTEGCHWKKKKKTCMEMQQVSRISSMITGTPIETNSPSQMYPA